MKPRYVKALAEMDDRYRAMVDLAISALEYPALESAALAVLRAIPTNSPRVKAALAAWEAKQPEAMEDAA